ncbi:hypothetical protein BLA23254_07059 [Burkholderia lata]|uniref:Uncharacterized protein n=1 Tax=Burkholderia lata (strain ATCC 17760 / DSM 23089 / LMG 22485 / NCIMB 9086 / R18194 / 383) TaxID=482957 RepID=A0A6P2SDZ3_BURL3|nr:hypothetical protein BLA23254_07059 [Burkholderia lata]
MIHSDVVGPSDSPETSGISTTFSAVARSRCAQPVVGHPAESYAENWSFPGLLV